MTRVEYRVELAPFHPDEETHRPELLARLNELGREGWRLVTMNPLGRSHGGWAGTSPVPMLLVRETSDGSGK